MSSRQRVPTSLGGMPATIVLPRRGAPAHAYAAVRAGVEQAWAAALEEVGSSPDTADEVRFADAVVQDTSEFGWRVVDAALSRLRCADCGDELGGGPRDCARCELADGFRFAAVEVDAPGIPPGTEHATRVAYVVARHRHRYPPRARCGFEILLPELLAGRLPTTPQAQAARAAIDRLDDSEVETVTSLAEVVALVEHRPRP